MIIYTTCFFPIYSRVSGVASQKFPGGTKLYRLVQRRTQDSVKGDHNRGFPPAAGGSGGRSPSRHGFSKFLQEKHAFQRIFFVEKGHTGTPEWSYFAPACVVSRLTL